MLFTAAPVLYYFVNDTKTTEIYTLSLHDALPISFLFEPAIRVDYAFVSAYRADRLGNCEFRGSSQHFNPSFAKGDRKSTRLNSSHVEISYAVFCLKKKRPVSPPQHGPPKWIRMY